MEYKLVLCPKSECLECFLARSQGLFCTHSVPHIWNSSCEDWICCKVSSTILSGCVCEEVKLEKK